jgi:hypothetical protein
VFDIEGLPSGSIYLPCSFLRFPSLSRSRSRSNFTANNIFVEGYSEICSQPRHGFFSKLWKMRIHIRMCPSHRPFRLDVGTA